VDVPRWANVDRAPNVEFRAGRKSGQRHFLAVLSMTRVLVTGGSGFIGTNIVEHYRASGQEVVNIDVAEPRCAEHVKAWRQIDVCDALALQQAVSDFDPDIVFHMAARTDLSGKSLSDYRVNPLGTENVIASVSTVRNLRRVVFASSMLVCQIGYKPLGDTDYCPTTNYGQSKVDSELVVRQMAGTNLPWVIVRPTSIWGPWFRSPYRDFFDIVRRGLYFHPGGSTVKRSYGYIGNTVHLLDRLCSDSGTSLIGKTVYVADLEPVELRTWANLIAAEFGARPVRQLPMPLFRVAAHVGDALSGLGVRAPMTTFRLNNMLTQMVVDLTPISAVADSFPYTVAEGVRATCEWIRANN